MRYHVYRNCAKQGEYATIQKAADNIGYNDVLNPSNWFQVFDTMDKLIYQVGPFEQMRGIEMRLLGPYTP